MIFIDWLSPAQHANFNRAFLDLVLEQKEDRLFVFSDELLIESIDSAALDGGGSRVTRAISVLKLLLKYRNVQVVLLTYDPLFIPIWSIFAGRIVVYEHNTTPENTGQLKHVLWQWILMRNIVRLAQFPAQHKRLKRLRQNSHYIGSPIPENIYLPTKRHLAKGYYVVASYRVMMEELSLVSPFIDNSKFVAKQSALTDGNSSVGAGISIEAVEYIVLNPADPELKGIVVTVRSQIRGTGWFNDAISLGIPIIITNIDACNLFMLTFPNYPFVDIPSCKTQRDFDEQWIAAESFHSKDYARVSNTKLKKRFEHALNTRAEVSYFD